jgi:hypothetical protein
MPVLKLQVACFESSQITKARLTRSRIRRRWKCAGAGRWHDRACRRRHRGEPTADDLKGVVGRKLDEF